MAAKLLHSFLLCSDINLKTLVGLSIDDDDHLLITCKSFVKRYKLHGREQVNSWITKSWHPFSTAAIRNPNSNKIVCIVNKNLICQWMIEETHIETTKKSVMKTSVHKLLVYNNILYVVYECGFVETFEEALRTRKEHKKELSKFNSQTDEIIECSIIDNNGSPFFILVIKNKENVVSFHTYEIGSNNILSSVQLELVDHTLMGQCVTASGKLISAWSDGNLYSMNIAAPNASPNPGTFQGHLNFVNSSKEIQICSLPPTHIAIQGMDTNEEGGVIALWDTKFGIKVSMKPMKMYSDPPLSWALPSGIVAVDGGTLAYIPVSLSSSSVASMLACRPPEISTSTNSTEWDVFDGRFVLSNISSCDLSNVIFETCNPSHSNDIIVSSVMKKLIETKRTHLLSECLSVFEIIPEQSLVFALIYFLQLPSNSPTTSNEDGILNDEQERLVSDVLACTFNHDELRKALRAVKFDVSWRLIQYLHSLLASGKTTLVEGVEEEALSIVRVCTWLCLLLDVNYHQLVLTSEQSIHEKLQEVLDNVSSLHKFLEASQSIEALADRVLYDQGMPTSQANANYSIEWISI